MKLLKISESKYVNIETIETLQENENRTIIHLRGNQIFTHEIDKKIDEVVALLEKETDVTILRIN